MACIGSAEPRQRNEFRSPQKLRRIGQLHEGHQTVAKNASIPSKYQTYITSNSERGGFTSTSKRFIATESENPGPATYIDNRPSAVDYGSNSVSSKKGSFGFASKVSDRKTKRFLRSKSKDFTVGPGQYNPQIISSKAFSRAQCTSNFQTPIAVKTNSLKDTTPAPNQYQLPRNIYGTTVQQNHSGAVAAFSSRSRRELMDNVKSKDLPAPGSYEIKGSFDVAQSVDASAPFKSKTSRISLPGNSVLVPGPGTYCPFEPMTLPERKTFTKKHYLCISAPAMPLPAPPPSPGPGHYNLVDYTSGPKRYVSSSMFVSTTHRWQKANEFNIDDSPGPASYEPNSRRRRSFINNSKHIWI